MGMRDHSKTGTSISVPSRYRAKMALYQGFVEQVMFRRLFQNVHLAQGETEE
jgi:hypothetical protein